MALNHIQPGKAISYTNATGVAIASGDPVLIGTLLGVALVDIANGASGSVAIEEVFAVRKASGAVTQGAKLYWDADGNPQSGASGIGCLTTTSTDNALAGRAAAAAAETDTTVEIKLNA